MWTVCTTSSTNVHVLEKLTGILFCLYFSWSSHTFRILLLFSQTQHRIPLPHGIKLLSKVVHIETRAMRVIQAQKSVSVSKKDFCFICITVFHQSRDCVWWALIQPSAHAYYCWPLTCHTIWDFEGGGFWLGPWSTETFFKLFMAIVDLCPGIFTLVPKVFLSY